MYTEEVNRIALSSNDDKRIQTFDKVTTHPYVKQRLKTDDYLSALMDYSKNLLKKKYWYL